MALSETNTRTITPGWLSAMGQDSPDERRRRAIRLFDWEKEKERTAVTPAATQLADFTSSGGLGTWDGTVVDSPRTVATDMAAQRFTDAVYGGLSGAVKGAAADTGMYSGVSGMMGRFNPNIAKSVFTSSLNPASIAPGIARSAMYSALGVPTNTKTVSAIDATLGLASMFTGMPAIGLLGAFAAPAIAEKVGKTFGTRQDENLKQTIENALGTGFLNTATTATDVNNLAGMSPAVEDSFVDSYGNLQTLGLSPQEASMNDRISAASALAGQTAAKTDYNARSMADLGPIDTVNADLSTAAMDRLATSMYGAPVGAYQSVSPYSEMGLAQRMDYSLKQPVAAANLGVDYSGYGPGSMSVDSNPTQSLSSSIGYGTPSNMSMVSVDNPNSYGAFGEAFDSANRSTLGNLNSISGVDRDQAAATAAAGSMGTGIGGAVGAAGSGGNNSNASRSGGVTSRGASGCI